MPMHALQAALTAASIQAFGKHQAFISTMAGGGPQLMEGEMEEERTWHRSE